MKKSEKIELRVDHTEKERLSKIAERRGQTISDVVRDALAGELGVAPQAYPRWPGVASIAAIVLAAGSLLWTVVGPAGDADADQFPNMSKVMLNEGTGFGNTVLQTQVAHRDGFSKIYSFKVDVEAFETRHDVTETTPGVFVLHMEICRKIERACEIIDQGDLVLSPPSVFVRAGEVQFFEGPSPAFTAHVSSDVLPKSVPPAES